MAKDQDQYVQFTIKLLKGSFALSALWQDAVNYHMIDQPDKLIAVRLTEYYELVARGASRSGLSMQGASVAPAAIPAPAANHTMPQPQQPAASPSQRVPAPQPAESRPDELTNDTVVSSSPTVVEQNAEEAADYWAPL
jgi:hypothetical protein